MWGEGQGKGMDEDKDNKEGKAGQVLEKARRGKNPDDGCMNSHGTGAIHLPSGKRYTFIIERVVNLESN